MSKKLTDMLANELKSSGNFTLVERQSINKVLSEKNWQNWESPASGRFGTAVH